MCKMKAQALTVKKVLVRLKFSKTGNTPRSRSHGKK